MRGGRAHVGCAAASVVAVVAVVVVVDANAVAGGGVPSTLTIRERPDLLAVPADAGIKDT